MVCSSFQFLTRSGRLSLRHRRVLIRLFLAFDSMGRHYDQTGNYTNWWDNSTIKAFEAKAQCFVDQYHAYNISDPSGKAIPINGRLTLGENIADAGGVSAAFAAWKAREAESPSELLPGLQHFSKEQLFFISYGNWWCGKTRLEEQVRRIYIDPHSPSFARILVSFLVWVLRKC